MSTLANVALLLVRCSNGLVSCSMNSAMSRFKDYVENQLPIHLIAVIFFLKGINPLLAVTIDI